MTAVASTSGGKWDPATGRQITFLAGAAQIDGVVARPEITDLLMAVNELGTGKKSQDAINRLVDQRTVLLDSGVFALASNYARSHGVSMGQAFATPPEEMDGWNELYDRWCTIASRYADRLWGVIELDQGGKDAARATREQVKRDTGIIPIPVYHPFTDGWDYYDEIAAAHDRICVGGLAGRIPSTVRMRLCWTVADRARAYPHLWTHLLGVTPSPMVLSLGLRGSTDSSAWLSSVRWAQQWRSWAMLQRIGEMPNAMTYRRDLRMNAERGAIKARALCAADAYFQQRTLAAVAEDTHPTPPREVTHP